MRLPLITGVIAVLIVGCAKNESRLGDDLTRIDSTANTLYVGEGQSSIVINNSGDSTKCYDVKSVNFKIIQIAPDGEWANYISKESSSTITCDGQEGQKRTIIVELNPVDNPKHTAYVIQHDVDEIILEHDYYQTVLRGCCDAEPIHKVYDYSGNLLVEGNAKVLTGAIPNNSIKFFVTYQPSEQSGVLGSIHLAYDAGQKYKVNILSEPLPPDMCSQYSPAITLVSTNRYDTLDVFEDEYQLWDLEPIES